MSPQFITTFLAFNKDFWLSLFLKVGWVSFVVYSICFNSTESHTKGHEKEQSSGKETMKTRNGQVCWARKKPQWKETFFKVSTSQQRHACSQTDENLSMFPQLIINYLAFTKGFWLSLFLKVGQSLLLSVSVLKVWKIIQKNMKKKNLE